MAPPQLVRQARLATPLPWAAQPLFLSSAWAIPAATSSPFGRDSKAARSALLPQGTSPQFFANARALCSAASTAKKSPSARSNLPAPAIAGPLHFREKAPRVPAPQERAWYGPASVSSISSAGWRSVSAGFHPLCRAAAPAALGCDSRTHRCPPAARETPPPF